MTAAPLAPSAFPAGVEMRAAVAAPPHQHSGPLPSLPSLPSWASLNRSADKRAEKWGNKGIEALRAD